MPDYESFPSPSSSHRPLTPQEGDLRFTGNMLRGVAPGVKPGLPSTVSFDNLVQQVSTNGAVDALACPICGDEMVNLAQLNRHLDDAHMEDDTADAVISWFRKTHRTLAAPLNRAAQKTTATLSAFTLDKIAQPITETISGTPQFELNRDGDVSTPTGTLSPASAGISSPVLAEGEHLITRKHWQREGANDKCSYDACGKLLGLRTGKRMAFGREYVKIAIQHEMASTIIKIAKVHLESNKLEKRLEKLTRQYEEQLQNPINKRQSMSSFTNVNRKALEQSIVTWQADDAVSHCPLCGRRDQSQDLVLPPAIKLYQSIAKYRSLVEETLPKYNNLLINLTDRESITLEDGDYQMAARYRKILMDQFSEMDKLGKHIKALPTESPTLRRIQANIAAATLHFLQTHMFTLQLMPKITRPSDVTAVTNDVKTMSLADMTRLSDAKQELDILQQQAEQVRGFLEDAVRRRRFEEVATLRDSLREVEEECEARRRVIRELEIASSS
ncbi:carboxypeptidase Y-deficient [Rhizophlyctis rosea]|nr:carboxypeptidase Y-deficient [Rhizophlyctis rosea]